ncbi:MAG: glucose-6-phosphate isomerase [Bacteroidales bacterium]|nr:glucose-6-phosphate isomerase [Bacteroidales bacterium]
MIKVDISGCLPFASETLYQSYLQKALAAFDTLEGAKGAGNDYLGWNALPSQTPQSLIDDCNSVVDKWIAKDIDLVVVIGIGGSYLGAKATIAALTHNFSLNIGTRSMQVVFAGNNLSEEYMAELEDLMAVKNVACVVISKSGTTTEPAIAFRLIKNFIEKAYGKAEASERIVAVTDKARGALKTLSTAEGYKTFVIPDDVGGRYSVLTPVGLVPIALAGFDINKLMQGARDMEKICSERSVENPAIQYAAARNMLYDQGKTTEILVNFNPKLQYVSEWWKQLYGESEGKEGKGIFPASVGYTTDLHSMGQYVQEGIRLMFETVLHVKTASRKVVIPTDEENLDGLNFLAGKRVEDCNDKAMLGTKIAHIDGGVPQIGVEFETIDEYNLGALYYFFEKACGVSGYILDINPFNQPGVEAYKKNMFALLGKPGYEELAKELAGRL